MMSLCEFPVRQKWGLIYRASRDGFEFLNFHTKCDNTPKTLVIVKSAYGNVFGGNTEHYSNFVHSYIHQDYAIGTSEANSFLTGSYYFRVLEIEVFTKQ
jgi:hypothetical protein